MKTKTLFILICNLIICNLVFTQNITNTLGSSGVFTLKDNATTYLTLNQSSGNLSLSRSLVLSNTTSSTVGVIYKSADRFIHNYGTQNTFMGLNSGNFTMNGVSNTAFGVFSLSENTIGSQNSAFGVASLTQNTTGEDNSAFGTYSLFNNISGTNNSAFGINSLNINSTGNENTAIGSQSLYFNISGAQNTGIGLGALYSNTISSYNTAVGWNSLHLSTGWNNTAVGHHSLNLNTTGNYNTALGYNAGSTITTGANLTCIGIDAAPTSPTALNQVTLGNTFVTSLRCNVQTITSLSDARDKKNITELSIGLDFITKLHPRLFNWDKREWYEGNVSDGSKMKETPTAGFIAQELDSAQTTAGAEWLNLVLKDNPEKWEATYGNLLPVMVKAIQELKSENDELKEKLAKFEEMQSVLAGEIKKIRSNNSSLKEIKLGEK